VFHSKAFQSVPKLAVWSENKSPGTDVMIFKNIFAKKFSEKIVVFDSKQSKIIQNFDHSIGF
jgi:hypothetical protein